MTWPVDPLVCGRCGWEARPPVVRLWWANAEREAREDRRQYDGPMLVQEPRCADKDACRVRSQRDREVLA